MTNKTNSSGNFFDTLVDAQQQAYQTLVENTKKFTNGNTLLNDTLDKGNEFVKKTVDATKETLDKMNVQSSHVKAQAENNAGKVQEFFSQWKEQQTHFANQLQEMNLQFMQSMMNPTAYQQAFQNWQQNWKQQPQQDWNAFMQSMNPTQWNTQMEKGMEQAKAFWNQFQHILQGNYNDLMTQFQNGTLADTYKGMLNSSDGFSKFYALWMPMLKSMQDKSFNMDTFYKNLNLNAYKEFMDKFFSFMPEASQQYAQQWKAMSQEAYKNINQQNHQWMESWKQNMEAMMPGMQNPYTGMLNTYQQFYTQMSNAVNPFAKLLTPNNDTKTMQEWVNIIHQSNIYNIKSAELQQMVYETGMKAMEMMAESLMHKVENGENTDSLMKLYQEYLNISDKLYVDLFETDAFSQLMSEVNTLKLGIKKDVEKQMEKSMSSIPVATRSEMDEVYQTIYDLKKMVRNLEARLQNQPATAAAPAEPKTSQPRTPRAAAAPAPKKAARKATGRNKK